MKSIYKTNSVSEMKFGYNSLVKAFAVSMLLVQGVKAQTFTFTPCGATGQNGPTQTQVNLAYTGINPLTGQVTVTGLGIQTWTVPGNGNYKIEAYGAAGGPPTGYAHFGRGASMEGVFNLTGGTVLKIIAGQVGQTSGAGGSGGGGSFVADNSNVPLIVAGGGSGGANSSGPLLNIMDGRVTNYGASYQSTGRATAGGGGGSFSVSGLNANGGASFIAGGQGGALGGSGGGFGGFGGGGGSSGSNALSAGGGGYSGGDETWSYAIYQAAEGGGGSFNAGTNQVNASGVVSGDGRVVITRLCNISLVPSKNPICIGNSITLTTDAVSGITWGGSPSTGNSISVSPAVTTSYSVTGTSTANCQTSNVITIVVNPLPVITSITSPTTLCVGKTATIVANGANTYTWSTGSLSQSATIAPSLTTVYTVSATSIYGCINSTTAAVSVNTNSLTVSQNTSVCEGSSIFLTVNGASTYTWSNGLMFQTIPVSPIVNTLYTVGGMDAFGCLLTNMVSVNVLTKPSITLFTDKTMYCRGENVTLTAGGGTTYSWSTVATTGAVITANLPADITYYYSVVGTDASGCSNTANTSITVARCLGINEAASISELINVYPNPSAGLFNVSVGSVTNNLTLSVYNGLGQLVQKQLIRSVDSKIDMQDQKSGIYFIHVSDSDNNTLKVVKVIKN